MKVIQHVKTCNQHGFLETLYLALGHRCQIWILMLLCASAEDAKQCMALVSYLHLSNMETDSITVLVCVCVFVGVCMCIQDSTV